MIKSLLRSTLYSGLASVFAYTATVFLAHSQSKQALSALLYNLAWGLIFAQVIDFGAEQCLTHFVRTSKHDVETVVSSVLVIKVVALACCGAAVAVANASAPGSIPATSLLFVVPGFYLGPVFEMRNQVARYARILAAERAAVLAGTLLYLSRFPLTPLFYMLYLLASLASLAYQVRVLNLDPSSVCRASRAVATKYAASYWLTVVTLISQAAYGHVSRLIVEAKFDVVTFGTVSLALQIVNAVSIVQTQVDRHIRPRVAMAFASRAYGQFRRLALRYAVLYVLPLVAGSVLVGLFAGDIAAIVLGRNWVGAGLALSYLSPLIVSIAVLRFLDIVAIASSALRVNLAINIIASSSMCFALALIPGGYGLEVYILSIVGFQAAHVIVLGVYLYVRVALLEDAAC